MIFRVPLSEGFLNIEIAKPLPLWEVEWLGDYFELVISTMRRMAKIIEPPFSYAERLEAGDCEE